MNQLVSKNQEQHLQLGSVSLPMPILVQSHGPQASRRFIEFFTAHIRNRNTREAYGRAVRDFFDWCDGSGVGPLIDIEAVHIAAYIEQLTDLHAPQTVKQKLAAIKALFDFLVTGGVLTANPASAVRGPRYSTRKGTTPILMPDEAKQLIRSIPTDTISGLRDRAIISTMIYSFARVSATLGMDVKDVYPKHRRLWIRLAEKGGKHHEVPCNHNLEEYLQEYIDKAGLTEGPLFRTLRGRSDHLNDKRLLRRECLAMIKRRCKRAGLENASLLSNHSFRGTGITAYLKNPDSKLENAQLIAGHSDPKTTRLYDRRDEDISLDEVEKIGI
ncbi:MAG: site-specific integrase [Gammaproteobacteria bacterium]|nr:site-specific integrase [Gammaproteobacteria bacterium]